LDELGRGTSTFDGYSIANAVLRYLVKNIKCRTLFATHYHMLLEDFRSAKNVAPYFMGCIEDSKRLGKINFTYKFTKGECPKSFGMNVASMSGLNMEIINYASMLSDQLNARISSISENCRAVQQDLNQTEEGLTSEEEDEKYLDEQLKIETEAKKKATVLKISLEKIKELQELSK
jgi:DNA mismatch repair protein MSH6